jgi:hypothetical protein
VAENESKHQSEEEMADSRHFHSREQAERRKAQKTNEIKMNDKRQ